MTCPYINPSIQQCENCPLPDCSRDERQDDREKNKRHYYKNLDISRKYHREYEREKYNTNKNTVKCRSYRNKHPDKKKIYDHERYLQRKERQVS